MMVPKNPGSWFVAFLAVTICNSKLGVVSAQSTSRLNVKSPSSLNKPEGYDHRDALFGSPPYGSSMEYPLVYSDSEFCSPGMDLDKWYPTSVAENGLPTPFILMVDRGGCTFVNKIRNAQNAGAVAVLIADNTCLCSDTECTSSSNTAACETSEPIMADDGSGSDITIPSMLIFKTDADKFKEYLKQPINNSPDDAQLDDTGNENGWDSNSTDFIDANLEDENFDDNDDRDTEMLILDLSWELPNGDTGKATVDLFTLPLNPVSKYFLLGDFGQVLSSLGDKVRFTPHEYVYDGVKSNCVSADGENFCYNLCTNNGRYCATDPDNDLERGISGSQIVTESLRRLCIWKIYGEDDGIGIPWWTYVKEFETNCYKEDLFNNYDCIHRCYNSAKIEGTQVDKCIQDSGGISGDVSNALLDMAITEQNNFGVVVVPTVFVNQAPIRGALSENTIFRATCGGFQEGTEPSVCHDCSNDSCQDPIYCASSGTGQCSKPVEIPSIENKHGDIDDAANGLDAHIWENGGAGFGDLGSFDEYDFGNENENALDGLMEGVMMSLGGLDGKCNINLNELVGTAMEAAMQTSTGDVPEIPENMNVFDASCTKEESDVFKQALDDFNACAGWDLQEFIETLPSAILGSALQCVQAIMTHDFVEDDVPAPEALGICFETVIGDNPFGAAIRNFYLFPDKNCPCFKSLSDSVPKCTLETWPIPIVGSWLKTTSCLLAEVGCGYFDMYCNMEFMAIDACVPHLDDELDCDRSSDGNEKSYYDGPFEACPDTAMSYALQLPPPLAGTPLPDACYRVYDESKGTGAMNEDVLERYERYKTECGSPIWETLLADHGKVADIGAKETKDTKHAEVTGSSVVEDGDEKAKDNEKENLDTEVSPPTESVLGESVEDGTQTKEKEPAVDSETTTTQLQLEKISEPTIIYRDSESSSSGNGFLKGLTSGVVLSAFVAVSLVVYKRFKKPSGRPQRRLYHSIELTQGY